MKAQCALIVLGSKSSPCMLFEYNAFIVFGKKIHPVQLLNPVFIKFWLFSQFFFFLTFRQVFFLFMPSTQKPKNYPVWLILDICTGINYSVHLFHHVSLLKFGVFPLCVFIQYCAYIKIGVIFHPVRLFHPVLLFDSVE